MIYVMFVCHGNICRSPMAEFVFCNLLAQKNLSDQFIVASSATSREEIGNPVHSGTRDKLLEAGISCSGKRAVQFTAKDYSLYDYILCMDHFNMRNAARIAGGDPQQKIRLLLSYAGRLDNIADPWYTGNFDDTWQDVCEGCDALLNTILRENTMR